MMWCQKMWVTTVHPKLIGCYDLGAEESYLSFVESGIHEHDSTESIASKSLSIKDRAQGGGG
eukprot:scaffold58506_cov33-Attheya_sp.AAC.2